MQAVQEGHIAFGRNPFPIGVMRCDDGLGAFRLRAFGLLCGGAFLVALVRDKQPHRGGIFVEVIASAETEMAPLNRDMAFEMIRRTKGAAVLMGARGRPEANLEKLADLLVNFSNFAVAYAGHFRSIELNPIMITKSGDPVAVDIALERQKELQR